jgi:rare lipoprotein A
MFLRSVFVLAISAVLLAACGSSSLDGVPHVKRAAFSSSEFGVAVSPRVSTAKNPPKGGGRYLVGKPYTVRGKQYEPIANPVGYSASGSASWYGADFHGRRTANGEIFSANAISGAHPTLPLPSYVRVTSLETGRSVLVRVNDRGPYLHGRVMDLSYRAAAILGYANKGVGKIEVEYVGPAPLNGDDTKMLLASVDKPTRMEQGITRLAMAGPDRAGLDGLFSLFGYAEEGRAETPAVTAAEALATQFGHTDERHPTIPEPLVNADLELGTFTPERAERIATEFARLGAVDEAVVAGGIRLTIGVLKPGATLADVISTRADLGLEMPASN